MLQATVEAVHPAEQLPALISFSRSTSPLPPDPSMPRAPLTELPEPPAPLRCRLGLHRWLPLALSVHGASAGLSVAFCRDCPQVRRPARLG